jgi:hypothetical protein
VPIQWYVIIKGSYYWTGQGDHYTQELSRAKLFTEEEKELSFCFGDEAFIPLPTAGDA